MSHLTKAFDTAIKASKRDFDVEARISTTAVDRDGDVMMPGGMDASEFRKNPVVLFAHESGKMPIGTGEILSKSDGAVTAGVRFAERPEELPASQEWTADTVKSLFKQGILRAFSVGFLIEEARDATERDVRRFGAGLMRVITRWKLLEFSVVPVPANQEALATAVRKGLDANAVTRRWGIRPGRGLDLSGASLELPGGTLDLGAKLVL